MPDAADLSAKHDADTLAFYEREATAYAERARRGEDPRLAAFIAALPPGARVLDLGCGAGQDALAMQQAGLAVTALDGTPGLAAQAERRLGRPVRVMRFEALDDEGCYAAVWANASLLHVPIAGLADVLARVWRALLPGGLLVASFKAGDGPGRDALGRYYNFPSLETLEATFRQSALWSDLAIEQAPGGGYDGVARTWLICRARKSPA